MIPELRVKFRPLGGEFTVYDMAVLIKQMEKRGGFTLPEA
jgi:hypothetical protein